MKPGQLKNILPVLALLVWVVLSTTGMQVVPIQSSNRNLGVELRNIEFPFDQFEKNLKSGLRTNSLFIIILGTGEEKIDQKFTDVSTFYDLWSELYEYSFKSQGFNGISKIKNYEELKQKLKNPKFETTFNTSTLDPRKTYWVSAEVRVNPLQKEKVEKIKQWIEQGQWNTMPNSIARSGRFEGVPANPLFQEVLKYTFDENASAAWKDHAVSAPFQLRNL